MNNTTDKTHVHCRFMPKTIPTIHVDIILIGSGIMSTTLGMFLILLEPSWRIYMYERLQQPAQESSNAWNNSGTGHAAFCELNYTNYNTINDEIDISKAIEINKAFELSLQFWSYLVQNNILINPTTFINKVPHMSFVWGERNVYFLKKRFQALQNHSLFNGMVYSEDPQQIYEWAPLIIKGRNKSQKIAATHMQMGTDINFGAIAQQLLIELKKHSNFKIYIQHNVSSIQQNNDGTWKINVTNLYDNQKKYINTNYIFIGGGGKSLNLLQTTNIRQINGYAGFPVGGQFLITKNPKIVKQHFAKVYGKASVNTPPMSVPHIDTRIFNGNHMLLFGPFANFSSKFLKYGSWLDFFHSLNKNNLIPMIQAGIDNFDLIKYLFNQIIMSNTNRINALKKFYPTANPTDWSVYQAGQRVQIIKQDNRKRGVLQFGTEIINSEHGTLSALLGASPGASIAVSIILQILKKMFPDQINSNAWNSKITKIMPSLNIQENNNSILLDKIREDTRNVLQLTCLKK